ncbi:MAG: FecR family protein [Dysgonomonas sp.]
MIHEIDDIIAKVLSGEVTDSEMIIFSEWIESAQDNHRKFLEMKAYWNSNVEFNHPISMEASYGSLSDKINQNNGGKNKKNKSILYISAIVASIAACMFLTVHFPVKFWEKDKTSLYEFKTTTKIDTIILPDQSKVILNKYSSLIYSNRFNEKNREVQIKGEALFAVARNESLPFVVELESKSRISVLGTIFNVKSYAEKDNINVTLLEGSIKFQTEKNQIILSPNQELIYNKQSNQVEVIDSDPDYALFWLNGTYKYRSIPLGKLMDTLSRVYGVGIQVRPQQLASTTVSGTFQKTQTLDEVLTIISRSLPIQWTNQNNNIIISLTH